MMKEEYQTVPDQESTEDLNSEWQSRPPSRSRISRTAKIFAAFNLLLFICSVVSLWLSWTWLHSPRRLLKQLSPYSPIIDSLPISFETVEVQGRLFNDYDPPIIYRQTPSPEVDKAWSEITKIEFFGVNADAIRKQGKDPSNAVVVPKEWVHNSDETQYLVQLDVQHQLHCLNEIRKYAFFDHYYGHKWANLSSAPVRHQSHLAHCSHILLQALTCQPSLDLIHHNWMRTQKNPYPDFNIKRQCVAHEPILEWQHNMAIPQYVEHEELVQRPKDFVEIEPEPTLLKIGADLGTVNSHDHDGHR